jgi:hypothetical protein
MSSVENMSSTETVSEDYETVVGHQLDRPYTMLVIGFVVVLMLLFLALKAGFSMWLMSKIGFGERLVNGRGEPNFWSVTKTLDSYQRPDGNTQSTIKQEPTEHLVGRRERLVDPRMLAVAL